MDVHTLFDPSVNDLMSRDFQTMHSKIKLKSDIFLLYYLINARYTYVILDKHYSFFHIAQNYCTSHPLRFKGQLFTKPV